MLVEIQPHQLRVPNPRPIQQLKDHAIPRRPRGSPSTPPGAPSVRRTLAGWVEDVRDSPSEFKTRFNSSIPGTLGRCFGSFGVLTSSAGFDCNKPTPRQPLEPAPHRRQRPRHTRLRQPAIEQHPKVRTNMRVLHPANISTFTQRLAEILRKPAHLTPIRPQRMLTRPALLAQHRRNFSANSAKCQLTMRTRVLPRIRHLDPRGALIAPEWSPESYPARTDVQLTMTRNAHSSARIFAPDDASCAPSSTDQSRDAYTPASSRYPHAPAASARCAGPRHAPPYASPRYAAACAGSPASSTPSPSATPLCAVSAFPRTDTNSARCTPCTLRSNSAAPTLHIHLQRLHRRPPNRHNPSPYLPCPAPAHSRSLSANPPPAARQSRPLAAHPHTAAPSSRGPADATPSAASPRAAAPVRSSISRTSLSAKLFGNTFQLDGLSIFTVGSCVIRLSFSSHR